MELQPCSRFEWERIVRRCPLRGAVKLLAYTLAQYGDAAGRNIRPGTPRLAAVCGMGTRTVERYLADLRGLGLVQRVTNGGGPNGLAAVYRLTVPDDLLQRLTLLQPDELTPATRLAAVPDLPAPVDNRPGGDSSPATQTAGDRGPGGAELPPLSRELPPKTGVTPATQVADHQDQPTTPTNRAPESPRHLPCGLPSADPDLPLDPEAERRRQVTALDAWTTSHPNTRETA